MRKKEKEIIIKEVNHFIRSTGFNFRFAKTEDSYFYGSNWYGLFLKTTKEIVVRHNAFPNTLAHEIAHIIQFLKHGETQCNSSKKDKNYSLISEHNKLTKEIEIELKKVDIYYKWIQFNNIY
jgi:hypothetical protein